MPTALAPKRHRLDDVGAAAEAAVDDDLRPALHRGRDLGQHLDRAAAVIELAPAVVGDVDRIDAVSDRDLGILGGGDALEDERDRRTCP